MQSIDSWVLDSVSVSDIDTAHIIVIKDIYSGVFHTFQIFLSQNSFMMKCS